MAAKTETENNMSVTGEQFVTIGRDGDQDVLDRKLELVQIFPEWFDGKVHHTIDSKYTKDGYLMNVVSKGKYESRLIAITSRTNIDLDTQF